MYVRFFFFAIVYVLLAVAFANPIVKSVENSTTFIEADNKSLSNETSMESSTSLNDGSNSIDKISDNFTSIEVDSKGSLNETSMESSAKINEGSKGELVNTKIFQNNGKGTLNQEDEKNEDNGVHYNIDPSNSTDASSEEGIYAKKNFTIPDFDNSEKVSEENHDPANNTRINLKNLVSSKIDLNNANNDDKDKNH